MLQALNAAMDARYAEHNAAEPDDVTAVTSEIPDRLANRLANRFAQRRADALTTMAETTLRHGPELLSTAERYQVVVHVTAETLAGNETGRCEFDDGQRLALDTVRRIACNGSLLRITEDDAGNPLDIGRKRRAIPPALRRALQARDSGCRFPGATIVDSSMRITSGTGRMAATPRSTILFCSAVIITDWCMKTGSASRGPPTTESASAGPMAVPSKNIPNCRPAEVSKDYCRGIGRPVEPSMLLPGSFLAIRWTTALRSRD